MPFTVDPDGRYRDANGRLVPDALIRRALDAVIAAQVVAMRQHTQSLIDGNLMLADWTLIVMQAIKSAHLVATAVAVGGWNQMGQEWAGWAGSQIKPQYQWLARFSVEISTGKQPLDGTAVARAAMYAEAGRQTHREAQRSIARAKGMRAEKNVLGEADHCSGRYSCLGETAKGWMPIGTLIAVGSRKCLVNCRCHLIYRAETAA